MGKTKKHLKKPKQKIYKMKGCSKKNRYGGTTLAYPTNNINFLPNPHLAYNGTGGSNIVGSGDVKPNPGPTPNFGNFFVNPQVIRGGCGCGLPNLSGGSALYPNGLVGSPINYENSLPGTSIPGNENYYANIGSKIALDPTRQMINVGAQPPFTVGGSKRKTRLRHRKHMKGKKVLKGGTLSNFIAQDLINLGRQFQYGVGSAYNAIAGYQTTANPMPWKGQLSGNPSVASLKASMI